MGWDFTHEEHWKKSLLIDERKNKENRVTHVLHHNIRVYCSMEHLYWRYTVIGVLFPTFKEISLSYININKKGIPQFPYEDA